jgi:hypothetical protein
MNPETQILRGPFCFLGPRPYREARLRAYIVREHRRGRPLSKILEDRYMTQLANRTLCWKVATDPRTIKTLQEDVRADFERWRPARRGG